MYRGTGVRQCAHACRSMEVRSIDVQKQSISLPTEFDGNWVLKIHLAFCRGVDDSEHPSDALHRTSRRFYTLRLGYLGVGTSQFLNYPPRLDAIFFVIARPIVHDLRPVLIPCRRIFVIQPYYPFRNGRECGESRPPRKIEGNNLLHW